MMSSVRAGDTTLVTSALSHHELVYARAVVTYNSSVASGGVKPDLLAMLSDLWTEEREPEVATVWDMVRAMAEVGKERTGNDVVSCAKKYLEKSYIKFIRSVKNSFLTRDRSSRNADIRPLVRLVQTCLNLSIVSYPLALSLLSLWSRQYFV